MINRMENRLYIFLRLNNNFQLLKIKFENEFLIDNVESNKEFILVSNVNQFKVFKISDFLNLDRDLKYVNVDFRPN
jgi:hypothetical protein